MVLVAWPITALLPTIATPLLTIRTAPMTRVSRAQRGSFGRRRLVALLDFPTVRDAASVRIGFSVGSGDEGRRRV